MSGRQLLITHRTGYRYAQMVDASFNEVRMTPMNGEGQVLLEHRLDVTPAAGLQVYRDYWGAQVEAFDVHEPHQVLEITATSLVQTPPMTQPEAGASWDQVLSGRTQDRWAELLGTTDYVDDARHAVDGRAALVAEMRACASPSEAADLAVHATRDRIAYTPGVTNVSTTATQAWQSGHGVCQDFTHVTLSLLRATRIPARYVSGYLHTEESAPGTTVVGESHAWVEYWDGDWRAVDPTNDRSVGSAHVIVARGRDYADVPPLKGIYAGGASEGLGVSVEIQQL